MLNFDVNDLVEILRDAGRQEIAPRFRNLDEGDIDQKTSAIDLVTQADLGAERLITDALRARFPDAMILGEEAYAVDHRIMSGLADAELAFVIDPVDGTFNFAAGNGLFGSILAVVRHGETVAGIICDPLLGDVLVAERGAGAHIRRPDGQSRVARVAPPAPLDELISVMTWSYLEEPLRSRVAANMAKVRMSMAYGCSAYEYWMVATGRAHFSGSQIMMPWDHLAGVLIHQEAGGYSARFDGTPYRVGQIDGGLLCAPDADCWSLINRQIIGARRDQSGSGA
ncbi:inositol monophosphatase family protein [Devosia sp. SL43]|uniref:inositol monophosphatase family protein n=1 Tax=Devosia sp. SL43 TaxID=2806348 RepID=UPI001F409283|nr:inositol monophosphatase [Devosia sp. SL43]UJW87662.1 inositol monophosphatase [Devosia sp. SL43]